jgi:thiamine biosynthesis lipoprotein
MRFLLLLLFLLPLPVAADWYRESRDMMGTRVSVELWSDDPAQAEAGKAAVFAEMDEVNRLMNPWDPESELSRMNREAHKHPVKVSGPVFDVITRSLHYSRLSGGAFDISFASAGQYYDYRAGVSPDEETLGEVVNKIDYTSIRLDPEASTVAFAVEGLQVDLGGIAKGYAVDKSIEALIDLGIVSAVVSAGGDSRILGNLGERPRTIGIRHPRKKDEFAVLIPLEDTAISTSGDYERFFIDAEGRRVHHILDPKTGKSSGAVQSASVLARQAVDSDALSTTTFVLGVERGLALINSLPDVDAIIIDDSGLLHYSEGLLREDPAGVSP